tara:strand:+ start:627 stop:1034 length:408 start_codon:yes stop_codon:yes gene_type:complete
MENYLMNDNEDNAEFQFFKTQLKTDVKQYLEIDDEISALNKALKERRKTKAKLADSILGIMKKFEVDNMNTKNGRLIYSVSKQKKPLNKDNIIKGLNIYFNDIEKAKNATKIVLENRGTVEKVKLKRTINKKNTI